MQEPNRSGKQEREQKSRGSQLNRRTLLKRSTIAVGTFSVGLPTLTTHASAAPSSIRRGTGRFGILRAEVEKRPEKTSLLYGGMDLPQYSVAKNQRGQHNVYITNNRLTGLSLQGDSPTNIVVSNEGIEQSSGAVNYSFDRLPIQSNPFGSSTSIYGVSGPSIQVETAPNQAVISVGDRSMTVEGSNTQSLQVSYTVSTRKENYQTNLTIEYQHLNNAEFFAHNEAILVPMTKNGKRFVSQLNSKGSQNGRKFGNMEVREHSEIGAYALHQNNSARGS